MTASVHSGMLLVLSMVVIFSTLIQASRCPATITCPEGYTCIKPSSFGHLCIPHRCAQRRYIGRCRARKPRYYFHIKTLSCRPFYYGGCRGNSNRFYSRDECERECSPL
ncbi:PI-actitoxin-Afv2b-like [Haliotis asinina]|uniref:PI-actitoxin-Afv2b-like n=1 Tax=Haliotis asinina TaxID=109174 RepID=UPI0035321380